MTEKIGFKEMWKYIEQERYRKIIKNKDKEISEMRQIIEDLLQYAPEDVVKDYRNFIND